MTQVPNRETPRGIAILAGFLASESAGGIVLMAAALAALIVANSPLSAGYFSILHSVWLGLSVELWINDGLMAIFFLMVGLEIKREVLAGGLATWGQRALPGFAAAGGMLVPALIYIAINWGNPQTLSGWAIPAATDIAFALGVLSLLGNRVPTSLKVFLAALAILDDLGAVTIIAFFYSSGLNLPMLAAAFVTLAVLIVMNRLNVRRLLPYLLLGALLWFFVLQSGVHATLAGVALALCIPMGKPEEEARSPLLFLEEKMHCWVAFAVVPIFGFANAGVSLAGITLGKPDRSCAAGRCAGAVRGQADRRFSRRRAGHPRRAGSIAGGQQLGAAVRRGDSVRHRFHHEPVHRQPGVPRLATPDRRGEGRRTDRLGAGRDCRNCAAAQPFQSGLKKYFQITASRWVSRG
ncbi:NhaA family Na+:H+ antiporter [Pseudomonas sp. PvP046]